jgi:hypothetical protein
MNLAMLGEKQIAEFHEALDAYLNCRPEAPRWLFELSDAINPVPVPPARQPGDAHNLKEV